MVVDNAVKDEDASAESPTSVLEDEVIFCHFFSFFCLVLWIMW